MKLRAAAAVLVGVALAGCSLQQDVASDPERGVGLGQPAPALAGATLDGGRFDLAAHHGQPVVIDFFASWCGPCQRQQAELDAAAARLDPRGVVFVGVDSFHDNTAAAGAYVAAHAVPYPVVIDDSSALASAYDVAAPPTTVVVDGSGRVRRRVLGGVRAADLEQAVTPLLGGSPPAQP